MSQTIENDSTICFSIEEVRVITKMTEDLKYTKAELEMADSVIYHQEEMLKLKDQVIDTKTKALQDNIKESKKRQIKTGILSGVIGIVVGVLIGIFI